MDQIFFNANPTQRQLADHASRSSDGLHGESKKSARKDKVGAAQEVDQAAVSADPATMGEEMMGDLDPDSSRRRKPPNREGPRSEEDPATRPKEPAMDENTAARPAPDHADLSSPSPAQSPSPAAPPSLMFDPWGDEFLIADPDRAVTGPGAPREAADAASEEDWLAPLAAAAPVNREAALNTLILGGAAPALEDRVRSLLTLFGDPVLALWHQANLRVVILEADISLPDAVMRGGGAVVGPPTLPPSAAAVRRGYLAQWRLVVINAEDLSQEQMSRPLRDLALGLDHALGGAAFASEQSRTIRQCFQACVAGGAEGPTPYFSRAVEAHFTAPARLQAADPAMADLMDALFSHPRENF